MGIDFKTQAFGWGSRPASYPGLRLQKAFAFYKAKQRALFKFRLKIDTLILHSFGITLSLQLNSSSLL